MTISAKTCRQDNEISDQQDNLRDIRYTDLTESPLSILAIRVVVPVDVQLVADDEVREYAHLHRERSDECTIVLYPVPPTSLCSRVLKHSVFGRAFLGVLFLPLSALWVFIVLWYG